MYILSKYGEWDEFEYRKAEQINICLFGSLWRQ